MPSKLLTDRFLARLKPDPARQVDYFDQYRDAKGLVIRVSPSGVRTWCSRALKAGPSRRVTGHKVAISRP